MARNECWDELSLMDLSAQALFLVNPLPTTGRTCHTPVNCPVPLHCLDCRCEIIPPLLLKHRPRMSSSDSNGWRRSLAVTVLKFAVSRSAAPAVPGAKSVGDGFCFSISRNRQPSRRWLFARFWTKPPAFGRTRHPQPKPLRNEWKISGRMLRSRNGRPLSVRPQSQTLISRSFLRPVCLRRSPGILTTLRVNRGMKRRSGNLRDRSILTRSSRSACRTSHVHCSIFLFNFLFNEFPNCQRAASRVTHMLSNRNTNRCVIREANSRSRIVSI